MKIKGQKNLKKIFALISVFSLVLQSLNGILFLTPAYAQTIEEAQAPTPTPTIEAVVIPATVEATPTQAPVEIITPTPVLEVPTNTPEPTNTPTPIVTETPVLTITPTIIPETQIQPEVLATSLPQEQSPPVTQTNELLPSGTDQASAQLSPSISTDKSDYTPSETALISGKDLKPNTEYKIVITAGQFLFEDKISTNDQGSFVYSFPLGGTYRPDYKVEIRLGDENIVSTTFTDTQPGCPADKILICHHLGSDSYNSPCASKTADVGGHSGFNHQDGKDIIPPFDYDGGSYPGQNWDANGQAIFYNGCVVPPPAPVCGNGQLETGEQCDDGNTANGDGCSANCQTEAPTCPNLFFSEYIEGSSNNKALEIYNPTSSTIDLAAGGYSVKMYFNGDSGAGLTINLTGSIAAGDAYILVHSDANASILAQADQTAGGGWYNGNDAVVLYRGIYLIDVIGQIGFNPGNDSGEWGTGLLSTRDNTLVRKCGETCGFGPTAGAIFDLSKWDGYVTDTTTDLGLYASSCPFCGDGTVTNPPEDCDINSQPKVCITQDGYLGEITCGEGCLWNDYCYPKGGCGDGTINGLEQCDDGNEQNGDGCNTNCKTEIPACTEGTGWATSVVFTDQGTLKSGGTILDPARTDPLKILGANDGIFFSLGYGGNVVLSFNQWVTDADGNDLSFHEVTWGRTTYPIEKAEVFVSQDNSSWQSLGEISNKDNILGISYKDISVTGWDWIKYVKLVDTTVDPTHASNADGFDLDAIDVVYGVCEEPQPEPVCGNGKKEGLEKCDGVDGVTTGQNFCTNTCKLIPIYSESNSCPAGQIPIHLSDLWLNVQSNTADPATITLPRAGKYLFQAYGDYGYGGDPANNEINRADPGYATLDNWATRRDNLLGIPATAQYRGVTSLLSDFGTGTMGIVNWGTYDSGHNYRVGYTTSSANTEVKFVISDWFNEWYSGDPASNANKNQGGMHDNEGQLSVVTYECQDSGLIRINKKVNGVPAGSDPQWNFEVTGANNPGSITLGNGNYGSFGVAVGKYTITESPSSGVNPGDIYTTSYQCADVPIDYSGAIPFTIFGDGTSATITVNKGQQLWCEFTNTKRNPVKIKAYKVVCDSEADLPNRTQGAIGQNTAQNWVNTHQGCRFEDQWTFQWAGAGAGSFGDFQKNTDWLDSPWSTFTVQDTVEINDTSNLGGRIELREIIPTNYSPMVGFSNDNNNNVSAEFYCTGDTANYDNWEWINNPQYGSTYYCVAFNAINYGSIAVDKVTNPAGDPQSFNFYLNKDDQSFDNFSLTDSATPYSNTALLPGTYSLGEFVPNGWMNDSWSCLKNDSPVLSNLEIVINAGDQVSCVFNNTKFGSIQGKKFKDINANGVRNGSDTYLDSWRINLYGDDWNLVKSMLTGDDSTEANDVEQG